MSRKQFAIAVGLLSLVMSVFSMPTFAHCDSYDGPVIHDARLALQKGEVSFVMKWIREEHEEEIKSLFSKTLSLKNADHQIYNIVEKHFLETLVRLHREGEGAPFTGLKPTGSVTPIIQMADKSIEDSDIESLLNNLHNHIQKIVIEKYEKVSALNKVKDHSIRVGRAYVAAYVDYTHTLEAVEDAIAHGGHH